MVSSTGRIGLNGSARDSTFRAQLGYLGYSALFREWRKRAAGYGKQGSSLVDERDSNPRSPRCEPGERGQMGPASHRHHYSAQITIGSGALSCFSGKEALFARAVSILETSSLVRIGLET
jgi:hypothetical protein